MNNNRFKFRVWNEEKRKYHSGAFGLSPSGELLVEWVMGFIKYPYPYVIEQCTGFRDKTGELIYEGDIVNAKWGPNIIKRTVIKHRRSGAFILEDGGRPLITVDDVHDIEIIGNIHEPKWGIESEKGDMRHG